MSEQSVHIVNCPFSGAGTANAPLFRVPAGFGGITLLNAWIVSDTAATIGSGQLNNNGTALGTSITTTIGTLAAASGTMNANVAKAISITTAYQAHSTWLAFQSVTGISGTGSRIILEYKYGK